MENTKDPSTQQDSTYNVLHRPDTRFITTYQDDNTYSVPTRTLSSGGDYEVLKEYASEEPNEYEIPQKRVNYFSAGECIAVADADGYLKPSDVGIAGGSGVEVFDEDGYLKPVDSGVHNARR